MRYLDASNSIWNLLPNTTLFICGPQASFNKKEDGKDSDLTFFSRSICKC